MALPDRQKTMTNKPYAPGSLATEYIGNADGHTHYVRTYPEDVPVRVDYTVHLNDDGTTALYYTGA